MNKNKLHRYTYRKIMRKQQAMTNAVNSVLGICAIMLFDAYMSKRNKIK
jgi:hypothetical protein